jgi:ABC-type bacteriocin/lantibiotic exporter with double-glycine peptidase domain
MPRLLILDEATSALDGITEENFAKSISDLNLKITRIIVAHRLATVINADNVIYLETGRILASGSFNEVRLSVPNFDRSAKLMGI